MKKIIRPFIKLFLSIASIIDKFIVVPITKLILRIMDFFKENGKTIDKFAGKKSTLLIVSLLLAFIVYVVIDQQSTVMLDQYAEILDDRPVTAIYNEELYVIEGLPETVDITLIGQKRHIFLAKQNPTSGVSVDLTGLAPGNHKVRLKYTQTMKSLDYKLDPSTVTVTIYEKESVNKTLTVDLLHQDNLDSKLYISNIELDRTNVIVKGAAYKLKQIATVKALVDVDAIAKQQAGETTLKDVPLVAYDSNGKMVDVEIVPSTVTAKLTITSPSKTVPIKIVPKGTLAFGKSIKEMTTDITTLTIYGTQDAVDSIEQIEVNVDVDKLSADKEFKVTIKKPNGITELSSKTVNVNVKLDDSTSKEFANLSVLTENLDSKYKVQAASVEDRQVTVVVKGSKDIIDNIDATSIHPYIDLTNYGPGTHDVEVKVTGDDLRLNYSSKTKKITVVITEK
ncbi:MAG: CdaR family protein [Bacilli bacterium]|nr:CdaR family protein [Bacilli bacterium]